MKRTRYAILAVLLLVSSAMLVRASLPQVATGTWQAGAAMSEARTGAASAALPGGQVLMTGGATSGGGITNSAEMFDPASNSWSGLAAVMQDPRSGHSASALANGEVLLAGGENSGGVIGTLEVYDPAADSFSSVGTLMQARKNHGAAVLADGRVWMVGGTDGTNALASSEIYDPADGSVTSGPSLPAPRSGLSATTLLDGTVLIAGGSNADQGDLASTLIYDPTAGTINPGASLAAARSGHTAILLPNNNAVLIAGGSAAGADLASAELYVPWTGASQATAAMSTARNGAAGSGFKDFDGRAMVAGGSGSASSEYYGFATVKTDQADYAPGDVVIITGGGWQPGESVTLNIHEIPFINQDKTFVVTADAFGNIVNTDYSPEPTDIGFRYYLTAVGASSQAQATFTDANRQLTIGPGGFAITTPTGATDGTMNVSQPFNVRLQFTGTGSGNWTNVTATLTVPAGWSKSADFGPSTVVAGVQQTVNWTVTPSASSLASGTVSVSLTGTAPGTDTCNSCPFSSSIAVTSVNPAALTMSSATAAKTVGGGTTAKTGDGITVNLTAANGAAPRATANTVAGSALTVNTTGTATGTCNATTTTAANIAAAGTRTYTYACTVTGGNGTLTYTGSANGTDENSAAAVGTGNSTTNVITVDNTAPSISSVTGPANGTYGLGQNLNFTVNYSENVTVTGTPSFGLTIGATGRTASYVSGSGTSALLFRYTVQAGDTDSDGIASASPIALNGGTIQDAALNNAGLTFTPPNTTGVLVDTTAPTAAISYAPTGPVKSGTSLVITATFSEPMADSPVVQIAISGANTVAATNMTKVDSTHYTYNDTVGAGNGAATVALSVGTDVAGNVITSAPTSGASFTVDNTAPTAAITYAPTGPVNSGTSLAITATFNEPIADSPVMKIAISGANTLAATAMTKTDSTHYTYTHTVGAGDGTATVALSVGTDVAGNVITSAPTSGATFTVDNTPPGVPSSPNLSASDDTGVSSSDNITNHTTNLTFTGASDPSTTVELFEGVTLVGTDTSNGGGTWSIIAAGPFSEGSHIFTAKSKDAAGNVSNASAPHTVVIDITKPTVTINQAGGQVDPAAVGPINFTVVFSESPAGTFATGDVSFAGSTAGGVLVGTVSGGPTTFNVAVTGMTTAGSVIASVPAGVATDTAGNANVASTSTDNTVTYNPDSKAPIVTVSFSAVDGQNGWYIHSPVVGTVDGNDSTTGNSNVTALSCTDGVNPLTVTGTSGIGTNHATGSISVSGEGSHSISCTATDSAGNTGAFTGSTTMPVVVKIDTVKPSLSATRLTAANGNGWNNTNVGVELTCTDATSGLASINATGAATGSSTTSPLDVTVTTEGASQSVNGSCKDAAGNSADAASVSNINIDKTKPTITGSRNPAANANGWNNTDVAVTFACTDNGGGSGVDTNTVAGTTLTTEGASQSASNTGSCTDKAGNTADPATVSGINIDKTAPTAAIVATRGADHGSWYNHALTFDTSASSDALSGLDSCTAVGAYSGPDSGSASVSTTCTDKAGNSAGATFGFKYDGTGPSAALSVTAGTLGTNGWYVSNVTVHTAGSDDVSGIESCSADQFQTTDTADHAFAGSCTNGAGLTTDAAALHIKRDATPPVAAMAPARVPDHGTWYNHTLTFDTSASSDATSGIDNCTAPSYSGPDSATATASTTCTDKAGNTSSASFGFKYDGTGPSAALSVTAGTLGTNGWYVSDVTIHTAGSDDVSGIESCSADQFQTTDTADHAFAGSCTNGAGLTTDAAALHIKRDATPPHSVVVNADRVPDHGGWYNHAFTATWTGADDTSGIDSCTINTYSAPETASGDISGHCTDQAGNHSSDVHFLFKYDATGPSASLSVTAGTLGNNNWYVSDVTIHTAGSDDVSGIESCSADQFQTTDTTGIDFHGSCTNGAGLSTNAVALHIMRDATPPHSVSGAPNRVPDHGSWYNHAVNVVFSGTDDTSGIDSCTNSPYSGPDGAGRTINGTCTDKAGNTSDQVASSAFDYDATKPVVHITPDRSADHGGWYNHALSFTNPGTDATSGIESCSTPATYSGPDSGSASVSASCTDNAGNTASDSLGFMYDATPPHDVVVNPDRATDHNGWYNHMFTATWSGVDDTSLIESCTVNPYSAPETAAGDITGRCTDNAGNSSGYVHFLFKFDATAPTLTGSRTPLANAYGWNNVDVTVNFSCSDATSGVDSGPLTPQLVSTEGAGQSRSADCSDAAGNSSHATVSDINIDKTPPTISASILPLSPAGTGWYNLSTGRPTVSFTCGDSLSGVASCTSPVGPMADGADQTAAGTVTDKAGNSANASILHIKVDLTPPTITINAPINNSAYPNYLLNAAVASSYSCSDATSGVASASCTGPVANGANFSTNPIGSHTFTVNAADQAGNSAAPVTNTYSVFYLASGNCLGSPGHAILQPINADGTSVSKQGSTVPAKFRVCDANLNSIGTPGVVASFRLVQIVSGTVVDVVDEAVDSTTPDVAFRWDPTGQQWIYNISTKNSPFLKNKTYFFLITLNDGSTIAFQFGLK